MKTDKRDCRRLARLHRAGELVAIRIPTPTEEAVRDLCRTRGDMVEDLTRARNRLSKFLLRHSRVWRGGSPWTHKHEAWLAAQSFCEPALTVDDVLIRVEVIDQSAVQPMLRHPPPDATSGRGIEIVDALASRWGVRDMPSGGKSVWFEVSR